MSNDNYTPKYSSDDPDRIEEALPDAPPHDTEIPVDTNDPDNACWNPATACGTKASARAGSAARFHCPGGKIPAAGQVDRARSRL